MTRSCRSYRNVDDLRILVDDLAKKTGYIEVYASAKGGAMQRLSDARPLVLRGPRIISPVSCAMQN